MSEHRPTFLRPPVVETVLGMQFHPIPRLTTAHLGLFWKSLGRDWDDLTEVNPIGQVSVPDPDGWMTPGGPLEESSPVSLPSVRLRVAHLKKDRLLQVENGWFVYNWQQRPDSPPYPRYDDIKRDFDRHRAAFGQFCLDNGFVSPRASLWEVGYINVVPKGDLWTTPNDWPKVLPGLFGQPRAHALDGLVSAEGNWMFSIGQGQGQLQVQVQHGATKGTRAQEMLLLRLIARGEVPTGSIDELEAGYSLGHDAIVATFRDLAGREALEFWGLVE